MLFIQLIYFAPTLETCHSYAAFIGVIFPFYKYTVLLELRLVEDLLLLQIFRCTAAILLPFIMISAVGAKCL